MKQIIEVLKFLFIEFSYQRRRRKEVYRLWYARPHSKVNLYKEDKLKKKERYKKKQEIIPSLPTAIKKEIEKVETKKEILVKQDIKENNKTELVTEKLFLTWFDEFAKEVFTFGENRRYRVFICVHPPLMSDRDEMVFNLRCYDKVVHANIIQTRYTYTDYRKFQKYYNKQEALVLYEEIKNKFLREFNPKLESNIYSSENGFIGIRPTTSYQLKPNF